MSTYALYKQKNYPVNIRGQVLRLRSYNKESGFHELVDLAGNRHDDIFIKEVSIDDVDEVYELKINVIYKGKEFETYSIDPASLHENSILLFSMDPKDVQDFGFIKHEQFVFQKKIALPDVDALVEIKKPLLKFEAQPESRQMIPSHLIKDYIRLLK
ncbi:hypothetical protein [Bacillus salipaludis]|uniref:Uncharacterized protein n=1 Tax=Bacillus salipaludis TaxID=2547811 RepID=A0ABW8RIV3_9BACI